MIQGSGQRWGLGIEGAVAENWGKNGSQLEREKGYDSKAVRRTDVTVSRYREEGRRTHVSVRLLMVTKNSLRQDTSRRSILGHTQNPAVPGRLPRDLFRRSSGEKSGLQGSSQDLSP